MNTFASFDASTAVVDTNQSPSDSLPGSPGDACDGWLFAYDASSMAREMNGWAIALGDAIKRALDANDPIGARDLLAIHQHVFTTHSGTVEAEESKADRRLAAVRAAVYPDRSRNAAGGRCGSGL